MTRGQRGLTGIERSSLQLPPHARPLLVTSNLKLFKIGEKLPVRTVKEIQVEVARVVAFDLPICARTGRGADVVPRPRPIGRSGFVGDTKRSETSPSLRVRVSGHSDFCP